jgi:hypothetical protein
MSDTDNPADLIRDALQGHAWAVLSDLASLVGPPPLDGGVPGRAVYLTAGGWLVRLSAAPAPADDPACPSVCDRKIRELLLVADCPLPAKSIRRQLEVRGMGKFSIATVKRALGRLMEAEEVGNRRKRPCGYYLRDHAPLFEQTRKPARKTA